MGALSADNLAVFGGQGDVLTAEGKASTAVYAKSLVMRDSTGAIVPNSTSVGCFIGLADNGMTTTASPRYQQVERDCLLLCTITSVDKTYLGLPVFCTTDNPADITTTWSANAKCVGFIAALEYNSNGAIANKCFVWITDKMAGIGPMVTGLRHSGNLRTVSAKTVDAQIYQCPVGRRAIVTNVDVTVIRALPNYATSTALDCSKVVAAVRTSLLSGTVDLNSGSTSKVADTPFALAGAATPFVTLSQGDRLEFSVATVGAATTDSQIAAAATIFEYGYAN